MSYFKTISIKLENTLEQHGERIHIQKCCALSPWAPNWVTIRIPHHGEDKCLLYFILVFDAPLSFVVVVSTFFLWSACLKRCSSNVVQGKIWVQTDSQAWCCISPNHRNIVFWQTSITLSAVWLRAASLSAKCLTSTALRTDLMPASVNKASYLNSLPIITCLVQMDGNVVPNNLSDPLSEQIHL